MPKVELAKMKRWWACAPCYWTANDVGGILSKVLRVVVHGALEKK